LGNWANLNDSGVGEDFEMLGDLGLIEVEFCDNLAYRQRVIAEEFDDF
jgi:hypothetical protein